MAALLAHAGFVLEPDLDQLADGGDRQGLHYQAGEVFLKASCAARSFCGWKGRGCSRVNAILRSHTPIVFSCTSTER